MSLVNGSFGTNKYGDGKYGNTSSLVAQILDSQKKGISFNRKKYFNIGVK